MALSRSFFSSPIGSQHPPGKFEIEPRVVVVAAGGGGESRAEEAEVSLREQLHGAANIVRLFRVT